MNFVTWSIRNPVPVIMMFIALVFGGIWAFPKLQIQDQPDISFPNVFVQVGYAGVPPSQMETEITRKIEDAVSAIVGIEHINSNISTGNSNTQIEFQFGSDLSQAMDDVRDAVSRIRPDLPIDATEPYIGRATTAGNAIMAFGVSAENLSDTELSWFVDLNVMRDISSVQGVGQVNRIGGVSREVRVDLDPDRMAALGVTAGEVSSQLVRTQVELPGGETRIGSQEQSVRTLGTIGSVNELAAMPISTGRWSQRSPRFDRRRPRPGRRSAADRAAQRQAGHRLPGHARLGRGRVAGGRSHARGGRAAAREVPEHPDHRAVFGSRVHPPELPQLDGDADRGRHPRHHRGLVLPPRHPRHADFLAGACRWRSSRHSGRCTSSASR